MPACRRLSCVSQRRHQFLVNSSRVATTTDMPWGSLSILECSRMLHIQRSARLSCTPKYREGTVDYPDARNKTKCK